MTPKAARKLLRKYEWRMLEHRTGIEEAPEWLKKLWDKCVRIVLMDGIELN